MKKMFWKSCSLSKTVTQLFWIVANATVQRMTWARTSDLVKHVTSIKHLNCNSICTLQWHFLGQAKTFWPITSQFERKQSSLFMVRPNMFENYKAIDIPAFKVAQRKQLSPIDQQNNFEARSNTMSFGHVISKQVKSSIPRSTQFFSLVTSVSCENLVVNHNNFSTFSSLKL